MTVSPSRTPHSAFTLVFIENRAFALRFRRIPDGVGLRLRFLSQFYIQESTPRGRHHLVHPSTPNIVAFLSAASILQLINAFAQSFISFAISFDPNFIKISNTITRKWNTWSVGDTEMLFDQTDNNLPIVTPIKTSETLLERDQFWDSVGDLTGQ
ncbi:hypothetical protein C8R44DRAFT_881266 [Mycena epipterygia]|nr:hypothetical protein C8R44DRAFT_881266 [Mycena epipterygia]